MVLKSQDIKDQIKEAAAEITNPALSFAFSAKAVAGVEPDLRALADTFNDVLAKQAQQPDDPSMFKLAFNNAREMAAAGSVDSVYTHGLAKHNKMVAERLRKRQGKGDIADILLALMDDPIAARIAELDGYIQGAEKVLDDLRNGDIDVEEAMESDAAKRAIAEWEKRTGKKFDPDADNAADVLQDILAEQIAIDKGELKDLRKYHNDFMEALTSGEPIDFTKPEHDTYIQDYINAGNSFNRENPSADDVKSFREFLFNKSIIDKGHDVDKAEQTQAQIFMAQWQGKEGTPEFSVAADMFIRDLQLEARKNMLQQDDLDPAMRERVLLANFYEEYDSYQEYRTSEDYPMYISILVEDMDADTRNALLASDTVPEEISNLLLESEHSVSENSMISATYNTHSSGQTDENLSADTLPLKDLDKTNVPIVS